MPKKTKKDKRQELKELLKRNLPGCFDREPAPAYSEGNLEELIDKIIQLLK
jgi:hypothetical protein